MKTLALLVSLVSIMLSITLSVLLLHYYKRYIKQKNDPVGLANTKEALKNIRNINSHEERIIFYGSSSAKSWTAPAGLNGYDVFNLGINGQTSSEVTLRAKYEFDKIHADIIILQVGSNDIKALGVFPGKEDFLMENFKRNILEIIELAKKNNSKIILTALFPKPDVPFLRKFFWNKKSDLLLQKFNKLLEAQNHKEDVSFFDSYKLLLTNDNTKPFRLKEEYKNDFMHINKQAYLMLNKHLVKLILKIETNN